MSGVLTNSIGGSSVNQLGSWMVSVIRATTESDVPIETVLTCCEFGNILPSTNFARSKLEIIARKNQNRTVNFLKSQVGWQNDIASVLAETRGGLNLLTLAAILCNVSKNDLHQTSLILNNIMESLVEDEKTKNHLPPLGSITRLLAALQPKLLRSGFEAMFLSWTELWENRLSRAPPHTYPGKRYTAPMKVLEHLIPAFIKLSSGVISSIRIRSLFSVPWLVSITCWLLGRPPAIMGDDDEILFPSSGSCVFVVVPTQAEEIPTAGEVHGNDQYSAKKSYDQATGGTTNYDGSERIEIKIYHGLDRFEEIIKPEIKTTRSTMMIEWSAFWRQRFRVQADALWLPEAPDTTISKDDSSSRNSQIGTLIGYWQPTSRGICISPPVEESIKEAITLGIPVAIFNNCTTSKVFDSMSETNRVILMTLPFSTRQMSKLLMRNMSIELARRDVHSFIFPGFRIIEKALIQAFPHHDKLFDNNITAEQLKHPLTTKIELLPAVRKLLASFPPCVAPDRETCFGEYSHRWSSTDLDTRETGAKKLSECQRCSFFTELSRYTLDILCYSFIHNVSSVEQDKHSTMEGDSGTIRVLSTTVGGMCDLQYPQIRTLAVAVNLVQTGEPQELSLELLMDWIYELLCPDIPREFYGEILPLHKDNWLALSANGQVLYHRMLETRKIDCEEGLLALDACPGVLFHRRQTYNSAVNRAKSVSFNGIVTEPTLRTQQAEGRPPWSLFRNDEEVVQYGLAIADQQLELEIFIPPNNYHERVMLGHIYFDYRKFSSMISFHSCGHPKDIPSKLFQKHCEYRHPLTPGVPIHLHHQVYKTKIGVVPVAGNEALRYLASRMAERSVLRFNACMDCCIEICLNEKYNVIIA